MKILITSDWYLPAVNGVVTSVKNLRRELEARGHEVRVLTLSQNRHSCRKDGVTCLGSVAAVLTVPPDPSNASLQSAPKHSARFPEHQEFLSCLLLKICFTVFWGLNRSISLGTFCP